MGAAQRVGLLVNPRSAQGVAALAPAGEAFAAHGVEVVPIECRGREDLARDLARLAGRVDGIVVGGGDGTLHTVLPALLAAKAPLGILPLGTANDFAAALGLPPALADAVAVIARGQRRRVDLGAVNGRPFLNVASVGLGAEVTRHLTRERKRRFGAWSYPLTALARWRAVRPFAARIRGGGEARVLRCRHVAIANGPRQGGRLAHPNAGLASGRLVLTALSAQPAWRAGFALLALRLGGAARAPGVFAAEAARFDVETRRPIEISADGEPMGRAPAVFESLAGALEVFVDAVPDADG